MTQQMLPKSQIEAIRSKLIRSEKSGFTKMNKEEILAQSKKGINVKNKGL